VNGAQGIVKRIWFNQNSDPRRDLPSVVFVDFNPGYTGPDNPGTWEGIDPQWVPIVPSTSEWERNGVTCSRKQFPLVLAWAITIHKSQGLSLDRAVIDIGSSDFSPGLSFVAISRVRTLRGLAFREYFPKERLSKPNRSPNMIFLEEDNIRRQTLENWEVNYYGQDLSYYQNVFDEVDLLEQNS